MRFRILGPLTAHTPEGDEVELGGPRQASVLAALLLDANRVVPLDILIDRIWDGDPPASATATLQAYISNLRKALEPERPPRVPSSVLLSKASGYALVADRSEVDALHFEDLLARARDLAADDLAGAVAVLGKALSLWRGAPLPELTYRSFARAEIARLEEMRLAATEQLLEYRLELGEHTDLVAELERLVIEHPLRERLMGLLMQALYRSGRQADAVRAFARLRAGLAEELGLEPGPELFALEEAILSHSFEATPTTAPSQAPPSPPSPQPSVPPMPAVGRKAEVARFCDALERSSHGFGSLLLIEGEAGMGKSHLVQAMTWQARDSGATVAVSRCHEGGGAPPYWPWTQVVRALADCVGGAELLDAAGAMTPLVGVLAPELSSERTDVANPVVIADTVILILRRIAARGPLALAFDDLYGADPDSLTVLTLVVEALSSIPAVMVGTYRHSEVGDDHPLTEMLARVSRLDHVERVPLARLQPDAVSELVTQVTGLAVAADVVAEIHRRTDGNALFTVELARLLQSENSLSDPGQAQIPPGVRDVIRRRLARLPHSSRLLLDVAAIAGRDFDVEVVAEVVGWEPGEELDAIDHAIASQLIEETERPTVFRFSHVLVQEALAHHGTALKRARLHAQLAQALERRLAGDPAVWGAIADHAVKAVPVTGPQPAIDAVRRAAGHAAGSGAAALALELWEQHLDLVLSLPPSAARDRAELEAYQLLSLAVTVGAGWANTRLATAGRRLVEFGRSSGQVSEVLDGLMAVLGHQLVTGQFDAALGTAEEIDRLGSATGDSMAILCGHLATGISCFYLGRTGDAEPRWLEGETLLETIDPGETGKVLLPPGQQGVLGSFWSHRSQTTFSMGRIDEAIEQSTRALNLAANDGTAGFGHSFASIFAATIHFKNDDPLAARTIAANGIDEAVSAGYLENAGFLRALHLWADVRLGDGSLEELADHVERFVTFAPVEGLYQWAMVADAALAVDDPAKALEAVDGGRVLAERTGARMWLPELERFRADALRRNGRLAQAATAIDLAERLAVDIGSPLLVDRCRRWRRAHIGD